MAAFIFNIAKGRLNEFAERVNDNDPATAGFILVQLKATSEIDATLKDYDTLALLLAGANTECDYTNYSRKVLTDTDIGASVVDDSGDKRSFDIADETYTAAGGAANNDIDKFIVCYAPDTGGADSTLIPVMGSDFVITTNGSDIVAQINASGLWASS